MAGGLIQIVTYGSQDLFLTGTPEITFFKIVYRRHTNFATESIEIPFNEEVDFGKECLVTIPRAGDLINKVYLKMTIPKMELKRELPTSLKSSYDDAVANYTIVTTYMIHNLEAYRRGYDVYIADNVTTVQDIFDAIIAYMSDGDFTEIIANFESLIEVEGEEGVYEYDKDAINMQTVAQSFSGNLVGLKALIFDKMELGLLLSKRVHQKYFDLMQVAKTNYEDSINPLVKFAWVDKLGHSLVEYIDLFIGGNKIDRHYGDWLNIWYELSRNKNLDAVCDKMIGNISELTSFDRIVKPSYDLYVPLQFWFCRNNGLALPLVALEYHDVYFNVKFRKIEEVSYMEDGKLINMENINEELYLNELSMDEGVYLYASLLVDYIYLDSSERRKFAQSSHEYLIEQVQINEFPDVSVSNMSCSLDFNHSCKELIWVAQKTSNTTNTDGYTQCKWDNYTVDPGNTIISSQLDFNGYERSPKNISTYYNYVQALNTHSNAPSEGINLYSFCLNPEEHQPSGQCNISRLSKVLLHLDFDPSLVAGSQDIDIRVYATNYNILRLVSGMAGMAYTA